jgi:hypothetical protein
MVDLFFDLYIVQEDLTHPSVPSQEGRQKRLYGWGDVGWKGRVLMVSQLFKIFLITDFRTSFEPAALWIPGSSPRTTDFFWKTITVKQLNE